MTTPNTPAKGQRSRNSARFRLLTLFHSLPPIWLAVFFLASALGIFVLPWFIPVAGPVAGFSYHYGFSNRAAILAVVAALAVLTGYRLWILDPRERTADEFSTRLLNLLPSAGSSSISRSLWGAFFFCALFTLGAVGWFFSFLPSAYFGETIYFIGRMDLMILGLQPFRDFQWNYGSGMLWPYYWLYRLCPAFSTETCYGIILLAHWALGLLLILYVFREINFRRKTFVFILFAATCFNLTLGLNYTPTRFFLPIASLFFAHRAVLAASRRSAPRILLVWIAAVLPPLLDFSLSPEMGYAVTLALAVYFFSLARSEVKFLAWCGIGTLSVIPLSILLYSKAYFAGMASFGSGGLSFPIYPTVHILFLLVSLFVLIPRLAVLGLTRRDATGSFALAVCVFSGLMILPSLGRCDMGHIFWNEALLLLLFVAAASDLEWPVLARGIPWAYALLFPLLGPINFWVQYQQLLAGTFALAGKLDATPHPDPMIELRQMAPIAAQSPFRYSKLIPWPYHIENLLKYDKIATPLGSTEKIERFLKLTSRYVPDYYASPSPDIFSEKPIPRKIGDLEKTPVILLPKRFLDDPSQQPDPQKTAAADSEYLSGLLLFPIHLTPKNRPFDFERSIMIQILQRYHVTDDFGGFAILTRNSSALDGDSH